MEYKDYYGILGVDKKATTKEIRAAYRRLAKKYHPDVNQGNKEAEARFKEINEAHDVLSHEDKRKKYDELGANWKQYEHYQQAGGNGRGQPFEGWKTYRGAPGGECGFSSGQARTLTEEELQSLFGDASPFSGFYQAFFADGSDYGQGIHFGRARGPRRGHDLEQPVEISLEEAFHGTVRTLEMTGQDGKMHRIEARIPAGVQDGSRVRLAGKGMPGVGGGQAGDLFLVISVLPHSIFERDGHDLRVKAGVLLTTAILGGEVEVPTLGGRIMLKVPPETQNGKVFRIKGKGMPVLGESRAGDLHVELRVILPQRLSDKERALFEELARLRGEGSATG